MVWTSPGKARSLPRMFQLNRIRIKGFRRLLDVNFELRPFQMVVGVNGSGKTSFLDAVALLAAAARGQLGAKLSEFGGISDVLTRDRASSLELEASATYPGTDRIDYELAIEPRGQGYGIERESLCQDHGKPMPFKFIESTAGQGRYYDVEKKGLVALTGIPYDPREALLCAIPRMFPDAERFRSNLASTALYGALNVAPRSPIRMPQPLQAADLPGRHGEELVSCLYGLRESDPDQFEVLQDSLRSGFPDFEKLAFPPAAAGVLSMTWKDKNFSKPLYMHQLSEGTLRFLWLATLLQSRSIGAVTLLDEPEISFHPDLQRLLVELMREASKRTRLIVSTHSDRMVRFLRPDELVVVDTTDGGIARLTFADQLDLADWLADYALDELWMAGRIGGRS